MGWDMVIQNISGTYKNSFYNAEIEKNTNIISQAPSNDEYAAVEQDNIKTDTLSLSTPKTPKTLSTPTKIYVDNVINNALYNISCGNNIEDNKRIIRLFSNLIKEDPENILRKAYNL